MIPIKPVDDKSILINNKTVKKCHKSGFSSKGYSWSV